MRYRKTNRNIILFILAISILSISLQSNGEKLLLIEWLRDQLSTNTHLKFIKWLPTKQGSNEQPFKITNSKKLADAWGAYKKNPKMNYEKMTRAMRYKYKKGTLKKVDKKRYCYSFVNNPNTNKICQESNDASQTAIQLNGEQPFSSIKTGDMDYLNQEPAHTNNNQASSLDDDWFNEVIDNLDPNNWL